MNALTPPIAAMVFFLGVLPRAVAEDDLKIAPAKPANGVYVTSTGYMKTVIELKDGHFRYWFESDMKDSDPPVYPLTGTYSVDGNSIKLEHAQVGQKEWTFRTVNGVVTLWRPDALKAETKGTSFQAFYPLGMENFFRCGSGSILVATKVKGEEAWAAKLELRISKETQREIERAERK